MEEEASSADLSCILCRNWGNGKIRKQLGAWLWFSNSYYKSQSAGDPVEDLLTMSLHRVRREDGFNSTFMWTKLESCYCLYVWYWYEFDQVLLFVDIFFTLNRLILFDTSRFIKERTFSVLIWKKIRLELCIHTCINAILPLLLACSLTSNIWFLSIIQTVQVNK